MPDIPRQREGQSFAAHQEEVARWMGCTVAQMNRLHDETHRRLAEWTGVESRALKQARGKRLSGQRSLLAVFLPRGAAQVAAHHALHREDFGADAEHRAAADGLRLGAGVEYDLMPNVYTKAEYRWTTASGVPDHNQVLVGVGLRF